MQIDDWQRQMAEAKAAALRAFPFETVKVEGARALAEWERLKSVGRGYPVVLGSEEDFARVAEQVQTFTKSDHSVADTLAAASRYRYPEDFRAQAKAVERRIQDELRTDPKFKEAYDELMRQLPAGSGERPHRGAWPDEVGECIGLTVAEAFSLQGDKMVHRPLTEATIALFPVTDWTEVFALSGFGGWNACPPPEAHIAAFRGWRERYRLELVGMTSDVLNLRADVRPATRKDALALAKDHYEFCPDLVDQGGPLEELAAELMSCGWWYFWWD